MRKKGTFCPSVKKMHELIEGRTGVEVIGDDFVVVGFGDKFEDAHRSHEHNLLAFLKHCEEQGVKLNSDKLKLRVREMPFIGHTATDKGSKSSSDHRNALTDRRSWSSALSRHDPVS